MKTKCQDLTREPVGMAYEANSREREREAVEKRKKKRITRECVLCGQETSRMSQHFQRQHPGIGGAEKKAARIRMIQRSLFSCLHSQIVPKA